MIVGRNKCFEILNNKFFDASCGRNQTEILQRTAVKLCEATFKNIGTPFFFTDHGVSHSDRVLHYVLQIADFVDNYALRISNNEAMALTSACYLHDLGMACMPQCGKESFSTDKILDMRSWHVDAIMEVLPRYYQNLKDLYGIMLFFEAFLPQLCRAHGTKSHEDACKQLLELRYGDSPRRGDLLGKILLLADELDVGQERSMVGKQHPWFESFPLTAKAHHFKHHYVIDVQILPTLIQIMFAFPDEMSQDVRNSFKELCCQKIQGQIELISKGLGGGYQDLFKMGVRPEESREHISRENCPLEVCEFVKELVKEKRKVSKVQVLMLEQPLKRRPNHFYPEEIKIARSGPLYPILHRVLDDFFKECNTLRAIDYFNEIYIDIPQNKKVEEELVALLQRYSKKFEKLNSSQPTTQEPFVIVGHTGAGKSTLLLHLRNQGKLCSYFSKDGDGMIIAYIDCVNIRSFNRLILEMLRELMKESKKQEWIWRMIRSAIKSEDLLKSILLGALAEDAAEGILRGMLDLLHNKTFNSLKRIIPVCFVLDNIDRMPGFELKNRVIGFAAGEGRSKGYPFFVITSRIGTKHRFDKTSDDRPAIAGNIIIPPDHYDVLQRRIEAAFSDKVLGEIESWAETAYIKTSLGRFPLEIKDLRNSIETAAKTLTMKKSEQNGERSEWNKPFIPSMAGSNVRDALTLFRAIIKPIDEKGLVLLSRGKSGGHYLIRRAMLEDNRCYFESNSKMRNLFSRSRNGFYFLRLYLLKFLELLEDSEPARDFVGVKEWEEQTKKYGFDDKDFAETAWNLMAGNLALIETEGTDDAIPNDIIKHIEDIQEPNTGVRISTAGEYYLSWLMYDISYLRCVLQDTVLDYELAEALGKPPQSLKEVFEQVKMFLDFLDTKETEERIAWRIGEEISPVIPELKKRLEDQKRALLKEKPEDVEDE